MNKGQVNNYDGKLLTYQQVAEILNLGLSTVIRLSRESGALVKIGKSARVRWDIIYPYIIENYGVENVEK